MKSKRYNDAPQVIIYWARSTGGTICCGLHGTGCGYYTSAAKGWRRVRLAAALGYYWMPDRHAYNRIERGCGMEEWAHESHCIGLSSGHHGRCGSRCGYER